jgi:hypothetical protein
MNVLRFAAPFTLSLLLACVSATPSRSTCRAVSLEGEPDVKAVHDFTEAVLEDIESGRYACDHRARIAAFDAIVHLKMSNVTPRLHRIVRGRRADCDAQRLQDDVAIAGALYALTELAPSDAVDPNVLWLRDETLREAAVANLLTLKAWRATPLVERTLLEMSMTPTIGWTTVALLKFLNEAPEVSNTACSAAQRVDGVYGDCRVASYCGELSVLHAGVLKKACGGGGRRE